MGLCSLNMPLGTGIAMASLRLLLVTTITTQLFAIGTLFFDPDKDKGRRSPQRFARIVDRKFTPHKLKVGHDAVQKNKRQHPGRVAIVGPDAVLIHVQTTEDHRPDQIAHDDKPHRKRSFDAWSTRIRHETEREGERKKPGQSRRHARTYSSSIQQQQQQQQLSVMWQASGAARREVYLAKL